MGGYWNYAAPWDVIPVEIPRRATIRETDLIAPAFRDGLVLNEPDLHG
jgi:hypothetical protein